MDAMNFIEECSERNWDGYDADPVSEESILFASKFICALPEWVPLPGVGVDPDGDIALDWMEDKLSLSFSSDGVTVFMAYLNTDRGLRACGRLNFS